MALYVLHCISCLVLNAGFRVRSSSDNVVGHEMSTGYTAEWLVRNVIVSFPTSACHWAVVVTLHDYVIICDNGLYIHKQ